MTEGMLRHYLQSRYADRCIRVTSAGTTTTYQGQPPAPLVLQVISERTADGFTHQPHFVTPAEVAQADLILVVAAEHRDWIAAHYPDAQPRTMLLSEAIGQMFDIPDPGVQMLDPLRRTLDLIESCVREGLDAIVVRATDA